MPKGQTATDAGRNLERLTQHAGRLDQLVRVCEMSDDESAALATPLHQDIRTAVREDYDAGDHRALSVAEAVTQAALYGAHAELSAGSMPRSERMLTEARKARRVIGGALAACENRR